VLAVVLDVVDEPLEQLLFLVGHPFGLGGEVGCGERGRLDDLADAFLVDGLDGLFGSVDLVREAGDLRRVEGIIGALCDLGPLLVQSLDELASVA
jgi:hypothetical protein